MAQSSCPKCGRTSFEVAETMPLNVDYKLLFVQCASCGAVIGAVDLYNIAFLVYELDQKLTGELDGIRSEVTDMQYQMRRILNGLEQT
jgi:uncharacterized Zn finger protein